MQPREAGAVSDGARGQAASRASKAAGGSADETRGPADSVGTGSFAPLGPHSGLSSRIHSLTAAALLRRARTDTASRWLPLRPPPPARLRAVNTAPLREPARRRPAPGPHQRGPIGCQAQVNHPSPRGRAQTRAGRDLPAAPSSAGVWPGQPSPPPIAVSRAPSSGGRRVPDLPRRAGPLGRSLETLTTQPWASALSPCLLFCSP